MSSAMPFFSSSSRSMRSMKSLSWSAATLPSAIAVWVPCDVVRRGCYGLAGAASSLVALDARGHADELLLARLGLARLPRTIGHAVDPLARRFAIELALRAFGNPVRQAVPAEAAMAHQVDVLDVF